jgi:hypothetical protein
VGQCKSEHLGFKKAKEITWDSANLRIETLRVMLMQFLDWLLLFALDFKKAKERTCKSASLIGQCKSEGKDSKRDYAKEKLKKTWDNASLRKETLKNRKESRC